MKWICEVCGENMKTKKQLMSHLQMEISDGNDAVCSAHEDVSTAEDQLRKLEEI